MTERHEGRATGLHRNVWVTSLTSFLTDVSSEMIQNVLPLFLANVLGVRTWAVGVVEGLAETTSALLKLYSGRLSDRLGERKWLAVAGYAVSSVAKPFYYVANSWVVVAMIRWADRVGKGVRTAPRDALLADSVGRRHRGLAFGLHRAADTGGAVLGILIAVLLVTHLQGKEALLGAATFRTLVLWSLLPAFLAVVVLAVGARDVTPRDGRERPADGGKTVKTPSHGLKELGRPFLLFLIASAVFEIGNSSDAFLILRAQERGMNVAHVLWTMVGFNAVYALVSTPAGSLADRVPRRFVLLGGWVVYALVYLGFARAGSPRAVVVLFLVYGAYHGLAAGSAKALVADLVPAHLRGTAYGMYAAVVGILALPASLLAGLLWQGAGPWSGFGPAAPFYFGAAAALLAGAVLVAVPTHGSGVETG
ncbi:MAG: MFS transporter [Gemmatimonadota bacterium]